MELRTLFDEKGIVVERKKIDITRYMQKATDLEDFILSNQTTPAMYRMYFRYTLLDAYTNLSTVIDGLNLENIFDIASLVNEVELLREIDNAQYRMFEDVYNHAVKRAEKEKTDGFYNFVGKVNSILANLEAMVENVDMGELINAINGNVTVLNDPVVASFIKNLDEKRRKEEENKEAKEEKQEEEKVA